jgi:23S rRNA pseudouridine1911/1915/1917 synthase
LIPSLLKEVVLDDHPPRAGITPFSDSLIVHAGPDCIGKRLDSVLPLLFPGHSRSSLAKAVKNGLVLVDGYPVKPSAFVRLGQQISFRTPETTGVDLFAASNIPLRILHEDSFLIAVDKQSGLSVHPGVGTPELTMTDALLVRYPELSNIGEIVRPGIVHRLDKDTSGVIVVARTHMSFKSLKAAFAEREARKRYLAFVMGLPGITGTIDSPISRHPVQRHRMCAGHSNGKSALSAWRVLRKFQNTGVSLVSMGLFTGRTHQARVHLASAGFPVLGDPLYGPSQRQFLNEFPSLKAILKRQLLHARKLSVPHPAGGRIIFSAPWPADFLQFFSELEKLENFTELS